MTLNKRELTLGHGYLYGAHDTVIKLSVKDIQRYQVFPLRFRGIPLAAEIITERLGLEATKDGNFDSAWILNESLIIEVDTNEEWGIWTKDNEMYDCVHVLHEASVHSLQNYMYTNYKKELEFKTKEG